MRNEKYRVLVPDAQFTDDAEVERNLASEWVDYDIRRVRQSSLISDEDWASCDALQVWHEVPIDKPLLTKLDQCRLIVRCGVGYDHIDLEAAGRAGIPVCNTPDYGTSEVADHAIGLMLMLVRGIVTLHRELTEDPVGNYVTARTPPLMRRIRGTRLGLVGLGRIGTATALRAKAFGMKVYAYDPYLARGAEIALDVERVDSIDEILTACPIVSLHVPLTSETYEMINKKSIKKMNPNSILINTARGGIVDLDAIHDALYHKEIGAAALDVLPEEPPDDSHPLVLAFKNQPDWIKDRLILTPHSAWNSPESRYDARAKSTETLLAMFLHNELRNCVNLKYLNHKKRKIM